MNRPAPLPRTGAGSDSRSKASTYNPEGGATQRRVSGGANQVTDSGTERAAGASSSFVLPRLSLTSVPALASRSKLPGSSQA